MTVEELASTLNKDIGKLILIRCLSYEQGLFYSCECSLILIIELDTLN